MKKALAVILAFIYVTATSGVVVSVHYCMGEEAGIAIGSSKADTCGTCGMDNDGCCHDDVNVIKLQDSHGMASVQAEFSKTTSLVPQALPDISPSVLLSGNKPLTLAHSPPGKADLSLNILHCVFRI